MKKKVLTIIGNPLFSGSAVMVLGSNATNFINYLYHLLMGRMLGPANYGELAALFSLMGLLGLIPLALNLVVVKYISSSSENSEICGLIDWFCEKTLLLGFITLFIITLSAPFIASFLKINNLLLIVLVGIISIFTFLIATNRSVLQGLLSFKRVVLTILFENSIKLVLGVALVYLGFNVGGAMVALFLAIFLGWWLSRHFLDKYLQKGRKVNPDIKPLLLYSMPILIQSLAITSLFSTDLIIVKHFFPSHEAGIYAALSTLGKIIFFAASPIGAVMFPMVSQKQSKGQSHQRVFIYSLLLTSILSLAILLIYKLAPQLAVGILYGNSYFDAVYLLFVFGVFMACFTLSVFLINFHLSLKRVKVVVFPLLAAISQGTGIWFFHNTLYSVIMVSVIISALLLFILIGYTIFNYGYVKK